MNRQSPRHKPDFFAVVVLLAILGFGLTLAVQVVAIDQQKVVETTLINSDAG
ncbi:MAG: hypothetical protein ABW076_14350 [Candidatus Thiodiazotropha sp.]